MKECSICYETKTSFFPLECCGGYSMCHDCTHALQQPRCPFCRNMLVGLPSVDYSQIWWPTEQRYVDSRWYRRHLRRIERVRQFEQNRTVNKILTRELNLQRKHLREMKCRRQRKDRKNFIRNLLHDVAQYS